MVVFLIILALICVILTIYLVWSIRDNNKKCKIKPFKGLLFKKQRVYQKRAKNPLKPL